MDASMPGRLLIDRWTQFLDLWLGLVVKFRYAVALAALALTAVSLAYTQANLAIDTDTTDMISAEAPFRRNVAAFDQAFPHLDNNLVIVIDGDAPEAVEAAADRLLESLRASPRFLDVFRPDAVAFFRRYGLLYLDLETLSELADRLAMAEPLLAMLASEPNLAGLLEALDLVLEHRQKDAGDELLASVIEQIAAVVEARAAGTPRMLSWQRLMAIDRMEGPRATRVVIARPTLDHTSMSPAADAIQEVRNRGRQLEITGARGLRLRLTGSTALKQEELQSAKDAGKTAAVLSLVLVSLLLGLGLRSARLVLATVLTLLMGLIWTAGFAALAVGHLNLISIAYAVLFVGLGVDFSIHYCLRFREEAEGADDQTDAVRRAGLGIGRPLAIGAVGAGIGFYAFLPTDYRGFAELGLISGTSMFIALAANYTVLPALLAIFRPRFRIALPTRDLWRLIERLVTRHFRPIVTASAVLAALSLTLLPAVGFDFNPINLKDPKTESYATFQELARTAGSGVYAADLLVADLVAAQSQASALAALDVVDETRTLASFVPKQQEEKLETIDEMSLFLAPLLQIKAAPKPAAADLQRALDDFLARAGRHLDDGDAVARAHARLLRALDDPKPSAEALEELDRRLTGFLPRLLDNLGTALEARPIALENLPKSVRRHWIGVNGRYRIQIHPRDDLGDVQAMRRFAESVLAVAPDATGTPVIVSQASDIVVESFLTATTLALVAIGGLLLLLYRSPASLALTLSPLLLAALLTLAVAALVGLDFNFANVIVLPLLFGLGIASSVHIVERRRQVASTAEVMRTTTPRAVLFSTLTTLASFGSLAISAHRGMSSMGQLLTVAIVSTLICTLVVLPSLMPLLARRLGSEDHALAKTDT
jgi:hypothetical protein